MEIFAFTHSGAGAGPRGIAAGPALLKRFESSSRRGPELSYLNGAPGTGEAFSPVPGPI